MSSAIDAYLKNHGMDVFNNMFVACEEPPLSCVSPSIVACLFASMAPTVWSRLMTPSRPFTTFQSKVDIIVLIIVLRTGQKVSCFWHMLCWPLAYLSPWKKHHLRSLRVRVSERLWATRFGTSWQSWGQVAVGIAQGSWSGGIGGVHGWFFGWLLLQWTYNWWIGARPPVGKFGEKGISMEFIYIYLYIDIGADKKMGGLEPKTDFLIFPWAPWLYRFHQWFQIGGSCSKGNSSNLGYHAWLYGWFPLKWSTPKYLRTQISWIRRKDSKRHLRGYSACILHETFVLSLSHFPFFLSLQHPHCSTRVTSLCWIKHWGGKRLGRFLR